MKALEAFELFGKASFSTVENFQRNHFLVEEVYCGLGFETYYSQFEESLRACLNLLWSAVENEGQGEAPTSFFVEKLGFNFGLDESLLVWDYFEFDEESKGVVVELFEVSVGFGFVSVENFDDVVLSIDGW